MAERPDLGAEIKGGGGEDGMRERAGASSAVLLEALVVLEVVFVKARRPETERS